LQLSLKYVYLYVFGSLDRGTRHLHSAFIYKKKVQKNDDKVLFLQELELIIRIVERPKTIHVFNVAPTAVERICM
jgi:hypothetical protein